MLRISLRPALLLGAGLALSAITLGAQAPRYDLVIQSGTVIDGSGAPGFPADAAIRRMTSLAAEQIGQHERGRIREGMFADITVFDPETIRDRATFTDPRQYAFGIHHVLVNGVPVIRAGALTGATPGRVLKGPAREAAR